MEPTVTVRHVCTLINEFRESLIEVNETLMLLARNQEKTQDEVKDLRDAIEKLDQSSGTNELASCIENPLKRTSYVFDDDEESSGEESDEGESKTGRNDLEEGSFPDDFDESNLTELRTFVEIFRTSETYDELILNGKNSTMWRQISDKISVVINNCGSGSNAQNKVDIRNMLTYCMSTSLTLQKARTGSTGKCGVCNLTRYLSWDAKFDSISKPKIKMGRLCYQKIKAFSDFFGQVLLLSELEREFNYHDYARVQEKVDAIIESQASSNKRARTK